MEYFCSIWVQVGKSRRQLSRTYVTGVLLLLIASSYFTETIGILAFFGAFVAGLMVPKDGDFVHLLAPKIELSRSPVRKGVLYDEWIGDLARRELGAKRWSRRVRKAVDGLRPMFVWDRLYVGGGNARRLTLDLGDDVTIVPNEAGISGGIRLWELGHGTVSQPEDDLRESPREG